MGTEGRIRAAAFGADGWRAGEKKVSCRAQCSKVRGSRCEMRMRMRRERRGKSHAATRNGWSASPLPTRPASPSLSRVSAPTQLLPIFGSTRFTLKLYAGLFNSASAAAFYALCVGTSGSACIASHAAMLRLTLSLLVSTLQFGAGQHAQAAQTR